VVLRDAFKTVHRSYSGPMALLFQRFQKKWQRVNQATFKAGTMDGHENSGWVQRALNYYMKVLERMQPLDNYLRLVELGMVFLAWPHTPRSLDVIANILSPNHDVSTRVPANQQGREDHSVFESLSNDLCFLKQLQESGKKVDGAFGAAATKTFQRRLWYLSEELMTLAFEESQYRWEEGKEGRILRIKVPEVDIPSLALKKLPSKNTNCFFQTKLLGSRFISKDPAQWEDDQQFLLSQKVLREMWVVNFVAERGVKLIHDYNSSIAKNEDQKQYLHQVVATHRCQFPNPKKANLL
ncbi:hypothetical protein Hamer_G003533, partial [Homarus americanus]